MPWPSFVFVLCDMEKNIWAVNKQKNRVIHRENSPVTQSTPESTLLS